MLAELLYLFIYIQVRAILSKFHTAINECKQIGDVYTSGLCESIESLKVSGKEE